MLLVRAHAQTDIVGAFGGERAPLAARLIAETHAVENGGVQHALGERRARRRTRLTELVALGCGRDLEARIAPL